VDIVGAVLFSAFLVACRALSLQRAMTSGGGELTHWRVAGA
jgi:hypothetical protein